MIVETGNNQHPFIAHTLTMRVPMDIASTDNVYNAMWAMLLSIYRHNQTSREHSIKVVACPGLGTSTGRVPYLQAARQMALAYKNFLKPPARINWAYADERQLRLWLINPPKFVD
jgi:O-acetyl-ADP-ribose deacetylase (regulator of RNase III)